MEFTESQVLSLKELSFSRYISELYEHCRIIFPNLIPLFDKETLNKHFENIIMSAKKFGYTQRGTVRFYVDMTIMFGSGFEYDPLYYWLKNNIEHELPQLEKSMAIYLLVEQYGSSAHGMGCVYLKESQANFKNLDVNGLPSRLIDGDGSLHKLLNDLYPQRYSFVGANAVDELIMLSDVHSELYNLNDEVCKTYFIVIMFLFGVGFDKDFIRSHLIIPPLLSFFNGDKENSHYKISSIYSCFHFKHDSV
ncbi:hypothetical protein [Serratia rubidaea]|uniref:hypothetical protein n=1 Tax=Serratia rubidaea TaxID=61652 RepID=UPI00178548DD|nr:hypothetical protein [Serratia rubidaea]MBD8451540.1 hypothetical protein [Serratia rubidaea]